MLGPVREEESDHWTLNVPSACNERKRRIHAGQREWPRICSSLEQDRPCPCRDWCASMSRSCLRGPAYSVAHHQPFSQDFVKLWIRCRAVPPPQQPGEGDEQVRWARIPSLIGMWYRGYREKETESISHPYAILLQATALAMKSHREHRSPFYVLRSGSCLLQQLRKEN